MFFYYTSAHYQNIVQEIESIIQTCESAIDCFFKFGWHIRKTVKSSFEAICASHISANDIKVTKAGRITM